MNMLSNLSRAEKKWPFGILFGIIGIAFAIYQTYFHEVRPDLQIEILSETSVFSIRESISDLSINFKGENLSQSGKELKILILKIKNMGNKSILPVDFQPQKPWGVQFSNGSIIDFAIIDSNSLKIKESISPQRHENEILFVPTIFEKDKFFSLKILMLVPKDEEIVLSSLDSIADIENVKIERRSESEQRSLADKAFTGDLLVQIARVISYPICLIVVFFVIVVCIFLPIFGLIDKFQKTTRRRTLFRFKAMRKPDTRLFSFIEEIYTAEGQKSLLDLFDAISESTPSDKDPKYQEINIFVDGETISRPMRNERKAMAYRYRKFLQESNPSQDEGSKPEIDRTFLTLLKDFLKFLDKN